MCKNLICFIALGLFLVAAAGVANAEIIAYWPFEEGVGDAAIDVVGQVKATLTGVTWVAGKVGTSAVETGTGDRIIVNPGGPVTPTTQDLSVAWWMVDTYDNYMSMMVKNTDSSQAGWSILLRAASEDSPIRFRIGGFQAYGTWGAECRPPVGAYKDNEWVHVVCTYDSGSDTAKVYINGQLPLNGNYNPKVGGIAGANGYCKGVNDPAQAFEMVSARETFRGQLDEVAIWDNALSAEDVAKIYVLGPLALDPRLANSPKPGDGATDVRREAILEWVAGEAATAHNVYMGLVFEDVNTAGTGSPLLVGNGQTGTTYDPPGRLEFGTTYYWRVDEVGATTMKGATWKFTTELAAYPIAAKSITVTGSSNEPNQGPVNTINGSGLVNDLHSEELTAMWLTAQDATGPAWIQYQFDRVLRLDEMWVWNHNGLLESMLGLGAKEVKIEYSTDGNDFKVLGTTHEFARAPGRASYACDTIVDLKGIAAKYIKLTILSNWGNILQQYGLSEVRFYSVPVFSREPSPTANKTGVDVDTSLSWRAGREAAKHILYMSTDQQAVTDGTAPAQTVTTPTYVPTLNLATTYYWRVDEVNDAETPSIWQGEVWKFTTENFDVIDDFEGYANDSPRRLFQTWIDGAGFSADEFFPQGNKGNGTGSLVGYDPTQGQIMETTTVHGPAKAMPLFYDNTASASSETTRTFSKAQNWTEHGTKALTLWFYGLGTNVPQQMYVKINSTKVLYDGDPANLKTAAWQMWYIPLASQNVTSVTSVSIGFDKLNGAGGAGKVLIDDLRLYPRDRDLITPTDPGTNGLQVRYQFDGNANDSSGKANNGTVQGGATFAPGKADQAITLDGVDDYVLVSKPEALSFEKDFTWSAWIKTTGAGTIISRAPATGIWAQGGKALFVLTNGRLRLDIGWVGNATTPASVLVNDDQWHHVAMTVKFGTAANETVLIYIDGRLVSTVTNRDVNKYPEAGLAVKIGTASSDFPASPEKSFFTGQIDDVRIYDRVISLAEVTGLAGKTVPFDNPF